jgi:23S rRNA (guanine745-N1)-methyltransferase
VRDAAVAMLACPLDGGPLTRHERVLRCADDHSFDLAAQGYVNLLQGPAPAAADTADMVAARVAAHARGLAPPVTEALAAAIAAHADGHLGTVVDVGAGPGSHLAGVLERFPDAEGLAIDLSKYAARRAARCHPRASAAVADVWAGLPLTAGSVDVLLDVFAPRDVPAFARALRAGGLLVIVTPAAAHLAPLVEALGLVRVGADKAERLDAAVAGHLTPIDRDRVEWELVADAALVEHLVRMGPSAHHLDVEELRTRIAGLPPPVTVTCAVDVAVWRRR